METKTKKSCPNCSRYYQIQSMSQRNCQIPLFLSCGHSMCEPCVTRIVQSVDPIECKVCQKDTTISAADRELLQHKKIQLYQLFPINCLLSGEIIGQMFEQSTKGPMKPEDNFYIDLNAIIKSTDSTQAVCFECHQMNTTMCSQCNINLCSFCFTDTHNKFSIFKNHVLTNIEATPQTNNNCKLHESKPLEYYCRYCSKSICMGCLEVGDKSCKTHTIVSLHKMNDGLFEDLNNIAPKVSDTYRRLTKTAVDVGHLLTEIEYDGGSSSDLSQMLANVEHNFSKLMSSVQRHKTEVTDTIVKLKCSEKESLLNVRAELAVAIKKAKIAINNINVITNNIEKAKQANLSVILDEAKQVVDTPWYLVKVQTNGPLKMTVNEEVCGRVSDYISLNGNSGRVYNMRSTIDLAPDVEIPPAPPAPVFPPELPKEVEQKDKTLTASQLQPRQPMQLLRSPPQFTRKSVCDRGRDTSATGYHGDGFQQSMAQQVQPSQALEPKPLVEGSQELVYMTHIVDPHHFYVQRSCHQNVAKELMKEFKGFKAMPTVRQLTEGKMYLLLNKADNTWQRCRVLNVDRKEPTNPTLQVHYVDIGGTETVTFDKLRLLRAVFHKEPRPLAIKCMLANCKPRVGAWTSDDAILMQDIIDNKPAGIQVRAVHSDSAASSETLEVDVMTLEGGVDLARALEFHERAHLLSRHMKTDMVMIKTDNDKPKISINNMHFKPRSVDEVYLTLVVSPDNFFLRKRNLQRVFEDLCEELDQEYTANGNTGKVYLPEVGMSCVLYAENLHADLAGGAWARAIVKKLSDKGRVHVFLPDCGFMLLVHWSELRHIHMKFTTLRALATKCHLAGLTPQNEQWHPNAVELLQQYQECVLSMQVVDNSYDYVGVILSDDSDEDNVVCINTQMIKHKFAITFGIFNFNQTPEVEDTNESQPENKPSSQRPTTKPEVRDTDKLLVAARVVNCQSPSLVYVSLKHQLYGAEASGSSTVCISDWLPPKPLAEKEFKAMPTNTDDKGVIYLHALTQVRSLEAIQSSIDAHFKAPDPKAKDQRWTVGEPCIAQDILDNRIYRGRVMEVNYDDSNCLIHYVDYGSEELCSFENMRKSIVLHKIPVQAHRCSLASIRPIGANNTLNYIHYSIVEKECLVKVIGEPINGIIPIDIKFDQLWMTDHLVSSQMAVYNDGLRPLVLQFAALPAEPGAELIVETESDSDSSFDSFDYESAELTDTESDSGSDSSFDSFDYESMKNKDWNDLMAEEKAPIGKMILFPVSELKEFLCDVTFINGTEEFELTVNHDSETGVLYKDMQTKLQNQCETMFPLDGIFLNKACVALYYEDNMWYRAEILQYGKEEKKLKVRYVDYGNKAIVSLGDVREISPELTLLPPATIAARLHAIKVNPQVDFATVTNEYESIFREAKGPLHAKVIEYDKSTPYVELRNDDGELAYNDLISKGVFITAAQ